MTDENKPGNKELSDFEAMKVRLDEMNSLILKMQESLYKFFVEILNPLYDHLGILDKAQKSKDESIGNIDKSIRMIIERIEKLERGIFHEKPPSMLS